jgi:hypothetical protein
MPNLKMAKAAPLASTALVGRRILFIRGEKIMVDADLAELYGVSNQPEPRGRQIGFTADPGTKRKS